MMKSYSKTHQRWKLRVLNKGEFPVIASAAIFPQLLWGFLMLFITVPAKNVTTGHHCKYLYINRHLTLFHPLGLWSHMSSEWLKLQ